MTIFWHSPGKLPTDPTDELGEYLGIINTPRIDHFLGFDRYGIFSFMLDFSHDKRWETLYNNPRIRREIKDFLGYGDPFIGAYPKTNFDSQIHKSFRTTFLISSVNYFKTKTQRGDF